MYQPSEEAVNRLRGSLVYGTLCRNLRTEKKKKSKLSFHAVNLLLHIKDVDPDNYVSTV